MRNRWIILIAGLLACGLLAAGCGGSDSATTPAATSEATTSADTTTTTTTTTEDTSTTGETTTDTASAGGTTADDVYQACINAISGTSAESAAKPSCDQAKAAFEQCTTSAESAGGDAGAAALKICQDAADQAVKQLQSIGG